MSKGGEKRAVKVMIRVRPFNKRELSLGEVEKGEYPDSVVVMSDRDESVVVLNNDGCVKDTFEYDYTFWSIPESQGQGAICKRPFAGQQDVYEQTGKQACMAALAAKHCCIFAYGQTGSGKTYTMLGSQEDPGISPMIVDQMFEEIEARNKKPGGFEYTIEITFMEIYNERVKDLLCDDGCMSPMSDESGSPRYSRKSLKRGSRRSRAVSPTHDGGDEYRELKVRNSPTIGVFVEGLTRLGKDQGVKTAQDVKRVMRSGMEHRATAETNMNATSSRSHAIFQLCLKSTNEAKGVHRYANINLVDLAGSERISLSKAEGTRLVEATRINLSLSTLRRVIDILIENSTKKKNEPKLVPPYRDSTLTWILSESLGGNSVTMMVATVSPFVGNRDDTVNTLRYAFKAKSIINTVRVNEEKGNVVLSAMQREMLMLKKQLEEQQADPTSSSYMEQEINDIEEQRKTHEQDKIDAAKQIQKRLEELEAAEAERQQMEEEIERLKAEDVEGDREAAHQKAEKMREELERSREEAEEKARLAIIEQERLDEERRIRTEIEDARNEVQRREELNRMEVQLIKRKQFAMAFQKAFARAGHSSGLDRIELDVRNTQEKIDKAQNDDMKMGFNTLSMARTNDQLKFSVARVEEDHRRNKARHAIELDAMQKRITELMEEKKAAEEARRTTKELQKRSAAASSSMSDSYTKWKINTERHLAQLRARRDVLQDGWDKKRDLVNQLVEQNQVIEMQIATAGEAIQEAKTEQVESATKIETLKKEMNEARVRQAELEEEYASLLEANGAGRGEITAKSQRVQDLREVMAEVSRNHGDLKRFATFRFFAAGDYEGPAATSRELPAAEPDFQGGNRAWTKSGYAYRRSASPVTPKRVSTSPIRIRQTSMSPQPVRQPSVGNRQPSRSAQPVARFNVSLSPQAVPRRSFSPNRPVKQRTALPL